MLIKIGVWLTSLCILGNKGDPYTLSLDFLNKEYMIDRGYPYTLSLDFLSKEYRIDRE